MNEGRETLIGTTSTQAGYTLSTCPQMGWKGSGSVRAVVTYSPQWRILPA